MDHKMNFKYCIFTLHYLTGATWGPPKFPLNNGAIVKQGFMLGSIFVDRITNTTFILYLQCSFAPPEVNCPRPAVYIINSTDDGKTWGNPRNLTDQIGHVTFAAGPGYGIQVSRDSPDVTCVYQQSASKNREKEVGHYL